MRVVFMGTPDFAVPALEAIHRAGHEIVCVYTQPPRPAGRGRKDRPSPVHQRAEELGLAVRSPNTLKAPNEQAAFADLAADVAVVAAYGLILPKAILEAPSLGCINIHASILPRWRGAAPIQRAIAAGDAETGVTIMQMDEGLDTGPILLTGKTPIGADTDAGALHDKLAALGAELIVEALAGLEDGTLEPREQPETGVTYAKKVDKAETRIDWSRPAAEIERQIRAFSPFPGAWFAHDGERIKVLKAEVAVGTGAPGTVLDGALTVACGKNALRPLLLQRAGKEAMETEAFLRGYPVPKGTVLP